MSATKHVLPPGPRLPRWLQTLALLYAPLPYTDAVRRRYGDVATVRTLIDPHFVLVFDPDLVKQMFRAPPEQLRPGESNSTFAELLGDRSVLVIEADDHMRRRKLLLPYFHGERMRSHAAVIRDAADRQIDSWPVGRPFSMLAATRAMTSDVIVHSMLGVTEHDRHEELGRRIQAMIAPRTSRLGMLARALSGRRLVARAGKRFAERRRLADELIYDEIARRRSAPDLEEREDVFSMLLLARYEDGTAMSDQEVRDDLVTLLLAGYETTATSLAWTFHLLLRHPRVLGRLQAELATGDTAYLRAVIKEVLRVRPVVNNVGRTVADEPYALGEHSLPPGAEIVASVAGIHRRPDRYPDPGEFRPERFLGPDAPDTYTWLPFGGGTRRCLGADFSTFEMGIVIPRVLERTRLERARPAMRVPRGAANHVVNLDRGMRRGIFYVPGRGVPVVQADAPSPA